MDRYHQLTADEVARLLTRECLIAGVADVDHWPVDVRRDGCECCGLSALACNAFTTRTIITGATCDVPCHFELAGSTLAELRESLIRHLCLTEHVRDSRAHAVSAQFRQVRGASAIESSLNRPPVSPEDEPALSPLTDRAQSQHSQALSHLADM